MKLLAAFSAAAATVSVTDASSGLRGNATVLDGALNVTADPFPSHTAGEWEWVPVAGTKCMDGRETGAYVKYGTGKGLGVYHMGGGACFNALTCAAASASAHPGKPGTGGIFSDTDTRNPFKDLNWVWIPYCTGDVHLGNDHKRFEGEDRYFAGRSNVDLILERAVATWPEVDSLLVTGESAGGFGALGGYDFVRSKWPKPSVRAMLLDDSGPIIDDQALPACLQEKMRVDWNMNSSLDPSCPCDNPAGNMVSVWNWTMTKWSGDSFGLISTLADSTISLFYAFGLDNCHAILPVGYTKLEAGLKRLAASGVPAYLIKGTEHEHTGDKREFYTRVSAGVSLYEWAGELFAGKNPGSVIPK